VPMFTAVSASISADPLANLLSALLLLVLARRLPSPIADDRWPLIAGALLGLGLLAKLALAIFVPLALLVAIARSRTAIRHAALLISTLTLVLLPWLVHQVTTYGWADPLATVRHAAVVADQPRFASLSPEYAWSFLTITFHSFWAQFGWMAIPAPDILYWIWGLLALSGAFGLARRRKWVATPPAVLLLATCAAACAALIAYNFSFTQFQGRYLFSALVPFATLLVAGWSDWLPSRAQALGVSAIGASLIAVNAYTFWRVLIPGFASIS